MDLFGQSGTWWLLVAVLLSVAELLAPGVFLVFLAVAAAITGALALLFPGLGLAGELAGFAAWSVLAVTIGRRWYRDYPVDSIDPLLNDRAARLLGEVVTVTHAIEDGRGRVQVGDGEWPARGPNAGVGTKVRIIGSQGACLTVEHVQTASLPPS